MVLGAGVVRGTRQPEAGVAGSRELARGRVCPGPSGVAGLGLQHERKAHRFPTNYRPTT